VDLAQTGLSADATGVRARFVLYGLALGLVAFLLAAKPFTPKLQPPSWSLRGETSQGEEIKLRLDMHGRVRTFTVSADLTCFGGGRIRSSSWSPSDSGAPARFTSRGPRLRAYEVRHFPSGRIARAELRGTVTRHRASGTVTMSNDEGRAPDCTSGPVRWSAG
jgi:hypothetical protein